MKSFFVRTLRLLGDALSFGLLYIVRRVVKRRKFQIDINGDGQPDVYVQIAHHKPGGKVLRSNSRGRDGSSSENAE